jgi:hypothetical protein
MHYLHTDLGVLSAGSVVIVELSGTEANVLLLDNGNLASYKRGDRYRYYGGHFRLSPARIPVPAAGRWHVVIDLGGGAGSVSAAVRVVAA